MRKLNIRWLGKLPYSEAYDLQLGLHKSVSNNLENDDYLLLLEHDNVITSGRTSKEGNLLVSLDHLEEMKIDYFETDRGGDITFHGEGQLIGYPIIRLEDPKKVVPFVRLIENTLIDSLKELSIDSFTKEDDTGVWTEKGKIASIGVKVSKWTTYHGFSLNIFDKLEGFQLINPCGNESENITSIQNFNNEVSFEEVSHIVSKNFSKLFQYKEVDEQFSQFTPKQLKSKKEFNIDKMVAEGVFKPASKGIPITIKGVLPNEPKRPEWMKVKANLGNDYRSLKNLLNEQKLNTVCEEASCPNIYECWSMGTATFMIMGDVCTRACGFCDVKTGKPGSLDWEEPKRVAESVNTMGLSHAVITSVNRDDLNDGGSLFFAETIREVKKFNNGCDVEVLIPDFKGDRIAINNIIEASPEVINHNLETVPRLQREIRTSASYGRSLSLLHYVKSQGFEGKTKTGLIVGMGESKEEVIAVLKDISKLDVDIVTIGQYLRPTAKHRPIDRYAPEEEFEHYKLIGESFGIPHVESGPLVRSSYHAKRFLCVCIDSYILKAMFDKVTKSIRVISAAAVEKANSGHPGMPMGMAEVGTVLFKNVLKVSNKQPDWINRDRFVLSAGHGSMLLYSLLHFNNFDISLEDIKQFRQLDSKTAGHPEVDTSLGIDITTGPLGQGFATGVGLALAESYLSEVLGKDIIDHYVYGIVSDGDLMEGISFEAAELAGVWNLGKLIYIFDDNNISIDGNVDKVSITNQKNKFESIGWHVLEVDGHNESEIIEAIDLSKKEISKPSLIIAKSTIGKFAPNKQNTSSVHGAPLGSDEMELFLSEINWEGDPFDHDEDIYEYFAEKRLEDQNKYKDWKNNLNNKLETDESFKKLWEQFCANEVLFPENFEIKNGATRVTGGDYLNSIGSLNKFIMGGSADLAASTKQIVSNETYTSKNRSGQNIEFGIREHSMAAVVNGINLHSKLFAYGSTFLVFSDYMRPSIRLASLMEINSSFIFTHDSIYLGEDGPTHQPVEHLMSLRLIPNLDVIRPSNSVEIIYSYRYLFSNTKNPKVLSLTRQNLENLDFSVEYEEFLNGGYIVSDGDEITIFASGSELNLAFALKKNLSEYSVRIVSVPILNKLNPEKAASLKNSKLTFTLELGKSIGWADYIGDITDSFSVETFGKSAPEDDLSKFFKLNVESIEQRIRNYLD